MKEKIILFGLVFGILSFSLIPSVPAQITNSTCQTTGISRINSTIIINNNNSISNITTTEDKICPFGCNGLTGFCNESSNNSEIVGVLAPILASFGMIALGLGWPVRNNKENFDRVYKILFSFFGIFLAIIGITLSVNFLQIKPTIPLTVLDVAIGGITTGIWLIYLVLTIFIILLLSEILMWLWNLHKEKIKSKDKRDYDSEYEEEK